MTRRKTAEKAKNSPEKVSRRSSRRGRKSPTTSSEREAATAKEHVEEEQEAVPTEQHRSDDSDSEQEDEEVRKRSRARRTSRVKASEEKTTSRPRRSSRRKSQSVEPSDKDDSEKEENGEHAAEKDTAVMETIPEEKSEEVQETGVNERVEPVEVEQVEEPKQEAEPEPEIIEENYQEEEHDTETEQQNRADVEPQEQQEVEDTKTDICDQSLESGEVDSESIQEDESQQAPLKTEETTKEASPEKKEVSGVGFSLEKEIRKSKSPKRVRKSRFRSRSKSPVQTERIDNTVETKQDNGGDKNDEELEAGEIKDDDVPKRSSEKFAEEKPLRRLLQRKRRWLSSKTDTKASVITISTDSLKNIISEPVKPVPLSDVKLESSPEPEEIVDSNEEQPSGERRRSKDKLSTKTSEKENIDDQDYKPKPADKLLGNRKISIVSDDGNTAIARPPSPAKHHSSNILYITNLVRPFTVLQLKSLLARTGKIVENGFWIDKIKSKCFVKYETEDEAVETRHALHGVRWPASNPKCLHVDFGTETAMEKAIISTLDDAGTTRITIDNSKEAKDFGWSRDSLKQEEDVHVVRPVREWDLGKKDTFDREDRERADGDRSGRERERERERDRDRDRERDRSGRGDEGRGDRGRRRSSEREFGRDRERRRGSTSVSPARKFKRKENEPPIRLLDDLFRKTKTTPCIYWLPLTAEQIAAKEEQRRKDMAENQRRQEEARKQEEERRKERERRDRERRERPRSNSRDRRRRSRSRDDGRRRHR